ncbi:putative membrane protein [Chryseobacterium sp. H1D6B]|uniref:hypothetical protein n=1 Tax=Chryseobacterium sp. H1D6B TaxID=2940588 RepID=UPI0015CC84F0|nr:hypothetical protein [Chryseobacterium sp. H1D6B]MDH6254213.1 putative membrane protein [Chryseobacterium sp. H1D6B]
MKNIKIVLLISIFVIAVAIITLLSSHVELLQNLIVKILLSLCTVLGILIGRVLDNFYNQSEKMENEKMSREVEEIGRE